LVFIINPPCFGVVVSYWLAAGTISKPALMLLLIFIVVPLQASPTPPNCSSRTSLCATRVAASWLDSRGTCARVPAHPRIGEGESLHRTQERGLVQSFNHGLAVYPGLDLRLDLLHGRPPPSRTSHLLICCVEIDRPRVEKSRHGE
jgi:hypothetical protein